MDSTILLAAISSVTVVTGAVVTARMTYFFTKRRERAADRRKMKPDHYKEYVAALSGIVEGRETPEGHIRYVDAVNTATLVASHSVLQALYAYLDYSTSRNSNKSIEQHDKKLTSLVNAIRQYVYPHRPVGGVPRTFRLITVPPHLRSPGSFRPET